MNVDHKGEKERKYDGRVSQGLGGRAALAASHSFYDVAE